MIARPRIVFAAAALERRSIAGCRFECVRERRLVGAAADLLRPGRDLQSAVCRRHCHAFLQQRTERGVRPQRNRNAAPERRALRYALQRADDYRPVRLCTCCSPPKRECKCKAPGTIPVPTTSPGARSINRLWIGPHRGGPKQSTSGAFGYGLCACNSDSGPPNGITPLYVAYDLPVYGDDDVNWYGGPPAFPQEGPSVIALGWQGYSLGFTDFAVKPVLGTYHLYAAVPPAYDTPQNPTPSPNPDGNRPRRRRAFSPPARS